MKNGLRRTGKNEAFYKSRTACTEDLSVQAVLLLLKNHCKRRNENDNYLIAFRAMT